MSLAIEAAEKSYSLIEELHCYTEKSVQDQDEYQKWFAKGQIGPEKIGGVPCCPAVLKMNLM
jgi:hypothetical protein